MIAFSYDARAARKTRTDVPGASENQGLVLSTAGFATAGKRFRMLRKNFSSLRLQPQISAVKRRVVTIYVIVKFTLHGRDRYRSKSPRFNNPAVTACRSFQALLAGQQFCALTTVRFSNQPRSSRTERHPVAIGGTSVSVNLSDGMLA